VAAVAAHLAASALLAPGRTATLPLVVVLASRQGAVATLTAALFAMVTCLGLVTLWIARRGPIRARLLWTAVTLGSLGIAADGVAHLRERLGDLLARLAAGTPFRLPVGPLSSWEAAAAVLYGVLAVGVVLVVWPQLLRYRRLFTTASVTGVVWAGVWGAPVLLRATTDSISLPLVAEEALRSTGAVCCVLTVLTGLVAARSVHAEQGTLHRPNPRIGARGALSLGLGVLVTTAAAGVDVVLPVSGRLGEALPWAAAVCGGAVTAAAALRVTRSRPDPEEAYADFWRDRAAASAR
jgi:hypothetical protein